MRQRLITDLRVPTKLQKWGPHFFGNFRHLRRREERGEWKEGVVAVVDGREIKFGALPRSSSNNLLLLRLLLLLLLLLLV